MILKGSQRGGARNLAVHLLKDENEHIDLVELRGFIGLWDRVSGETARIQRENEFEAWEALKADNAARDELVWSQIQQRQLLQRDVKAMRKQHRLERQDLDEEIGAALAFEKRAEREAALRRAHEEKQQKKRSQDRGLER